MKSFKPILGKLTTEDILMCVTVGPDKFSFDEKECYLFESAKNSKKNTRPHIVKQYWICALKTSFKNNSFYCLQWNKIYCIVTYENDFSYQNKKWWGLAQLLWFCLLPLLSTVHLEKRTWYAGKSIAVILEGEKIWGYQ